MGLCVGEQEKVLPRVLDVLAKFAPTLDVRRAMHSTEEASKFGWWKCQNRSLTLVKKNSQVYCKQLAGSTLSAWLTFTPRRAVHGGTSTPLDPSTFTHNLVITNHFSDMESYQVQLHLQQF